MNLSQNSIYIISSTLVGVIGVIVFLGIQRKKHNKQVQKDNKTNNTEFTLMDNALKLQLANQNEEALKIFNKVLETNKDNHLTYYLKGDSETQLQQFNNAEKSYKQSLKLKETPEVYLSLGNLYQKQMKFHLALEQYEKSLELKPKNSTVFLNKGIVYHHMQNYDECLKCFDTAIGLGLKEAYVHKGMTLHKLGKFDDALEVFDKVISRYPEITSFRFHKANTLVAYDKLEEALQCYKDILKYDPNSKDIQFRIEKLTELIEQKQNN